MIDPTNADRAAWARAALAHFPAASHDDVTTDARDLITDLLHLIDQAGEQEATEAAQMATRMYEQEKEEDE